MSGDDDIRDVIHREVGRLAADNTLAGYDRGWLRGCIVGIAIGIAGTVVAFSLPALFGG